MYCTVQYLLYIYSHDMSWNKMISYLFVNFLSICLRWFGGQNHTYLQTGAHGSQRPWLGLRSVWGRLCYGSSGWVQLRASMRLGQLQEWEWQAFDRQNNYATLLKTAPTISGTASMVTIRASGCMCLFKVDRYRSYYSRNAGYSFCRSQLWPFWNFTWKPPLSAQDASIHPPAAPFRAYWFTSAGGIAAEIDSDSGLAGRYSLPTHPAAWG